MALQLRTKHRSITNPTLIHFFSSTSNPDTPSPPDPTTPKPQSTSSFSSHFSDVKSSLKHQTPKLTSLDEIHKNLSEFRLRSSPPSPNPVTFQELVDRKVINTSPDNGQEGKIPFAKIRESLRQMKQTSQSQPNKNNANQHTSFAIFKNNNPPSFFNDNSRNVIGGGSEGLPASIFGRESKGEKDNAMKDSMRSEFMKTYTQSELGEKLKKLRPEKEGGDWFSLKELSERLEKLREIDEKEMESSKTGSLPFAELRESLKKLHMADENEKKNKTIQRLDILGQLGRTPNFMLSPPKEHLVEQYFHPDNMSSAEKMKIELQKVRDEFKMSESDCGSARVQVAQLTTKIKHLSTVLHKKDKHSRKGLQAMVQQRKKLLKYLRRTDWDSYCLVLSKLGLRDNPDYKH